jgi:Zn-dependent peptidase ImmA (M78 family)
MPAKLESNIDWSKIDPLIVNLRKEQNLRWADIARRINVSSVTVYWRAKKLNLVKTRISTNKNPNVKDNSNRLALPAGHPECWKLLWPNGNGPSFTNLYGPKV